MCKNPGYTLLLGHRCYQIHWDYLSFFHSENSPLTTFATAGRKKTHGLRENGERQGGGDNAWQSQRGHVGLFVSSCKQLFLGDLLLLLSKAATAANAIGTGFATRPSPSANQEAHVAWGRAPFLLEVPDNWKHNCKTCSRKQKQTFFLNNQRVSCQASGIPHLEIFHWGSYRNMSIPLIKDQRHRAWSHPSGWSACCASVRTKVQIPISNIPVTPALGVGMGWRKDLLASQPR